MNMQLVSELLLLLLSVGTAQQLLCGLDAC